MNSKGAAILLIYLILFITLFILFPKVMAIVTGVSLIVTFFVVVFAKRQ